MKTLEQLHSEVMENDELKARFIEAAKDEKTIAAFLKENDCDATVEQLKTFMGEQGEGEISDAEVEAVAGGSAKNTTVLSCLTVSVGCLAAVAVSYAAGKGANTNADTYACGKC